MNKTEGSTLNVPELRRLLEKATPRPWEIRHTVGAWPEHEIVANGLVIGGFFEVDGEPQEADVILIAALANAAPALLDRLEAAERVATTADNYVTLNASLEELEAAVRVYREDEDMAALDKAGPS